MAKLPTQLLACIFFIVLVLYSCPATSQEVEDESEFNYDENSDHGPARWGEIHPEEWGFCSNGTMQSPIDMSNERVKIVSHLGRLKKSYKPSNASLRNRGHDMMLQWEGEAGALEINGIEYELRQCHWHSPSEHTINGRSHDLEVHMVHQSADGKIAVIGIMYKIGRPDPFLSSLVDHLTAITDITEGETAVGVIDPRQIKFGSRKYYRYLGSLTTPPCTENVVWTIVRKVRTVTREQVRLLRVAVHDDSDTNARPRQPLNNRPIKLFRPDDDEEN